MDNIRHIYKYIIHSTWLTALVEIRIKNEVSWKYHLSLSISFWTLDINKNYLMSETAALQLKLIILSIPSVSLRLSYFCVHRLAYLSTSPLI